MSKLSFEEEYALIREYIAYCPLSGKFIWRKNKGHVRAGSEAGGIDISTGYRQIRLNKKLYYCHRIAWLLEKGVWPKVCIDHINRDRLDNRICNLREATRKENSWNTGIRKNNKSGSHCVYWHKKANKWCVQMSEDSKTKYVGVFSNKEDAEKAVSTFVNTYRKLDKTEIERLKIE